MAKHDSGEIRCTAIALIFSFKPLITECVEFCVVVIVSYNGMFASFSSALENENIYCALVSENCNCMLLVHQICFGELKYIHHLLGTNKAWLGILSINDAANQW